MLVRRVTHLSLVDLFWESTSHLGNTYDNLTPLGTLIISLFIAIIILPGIKTDFSGEMVWWEPWWVYWFKDRKKDGTEE